jgi:hypothetical protein
LLHLRRVELQAVVALRLVQALPAQVAAVLVVMVAEREYHQRAEQ